MRTPLLRPGLAAFMALAMLIACPGCSSPGGGAGNQGPWRESNAALSAARAGNSFALHRSFHAAYAQLMRRAPNEGTEAQDISSNLDSILTSVGDERFAAALSRENEKVRGAVRDCMVEGDISAHYPRTYALFQQAPQAEWPSDDANDTAFALGRGRTAKKSWIPKPDSSGPSN